MDVQTLNLGFDPADIKGLSEKLLRSHHENNYAGAVKRLNGIRKRLREVAFATVAGFDLNGLKREELIATNSMLLHELYFDSLGATDQVMSPLMALALEANFGTVQRWRDEFCSMGKSLGGGSGWVLLMFQPREGKLVNQWAADHTHAIAGGVPMLALDMYEHAYHIDFGASASAYVDVFMKNIAWARVHERYQSAVEVASKPLQGSEDQIQGAIVLDVRRAGAFDKADAVIPGAQWRDPAQVSTWAAQLSKEAPLMVYCEYGHEVSQATAMQLRAWGIGARYLHGGIDAWRSAGRPLEKKQN